MSDDFMETASGLVPLKDGWWLVSATGHRISPEGVVYDENMDPVGKAIFLDEELLGEEEED